MPTILLHLSNGFPAAPLTLVTEPLRVANRELGRAVYDWRFVSDQGGSVASSSGIEIPTVPLPEDRPDALVVLASYGPERAATPRTLSWLRKMDRAGCLMGCVDTGAFIFAKAGLLHTHPATAHPEALAGLSRQFPRSLFIDRVVDFTLPRFSAIGGVATMEMTLDLITHFSGRPTARRVAEIFAYRPGVLSAPNLPSPAALSIPELRAVVQLMEQHLSDPRPISEIAARLGTPGWRLNRLFRRYLHASPTSYYVTLRLERARHMLRNSALPVGEIASDCGYQNGEVFARAYKARFGLPPSRDRGV